jgi:hypothetical protein
MSTDNGKDDDISARRIIREALCRIFENRGYFGLSICLESEVFDVTVDNISNPKEGFSWNELNANNNDNYR